MPQLRPKGLQLRPRAAYIDIDMDIGIDLSIYIYIYPITSVVLDYLRLHGL